MAQPKRSTLYTKGGDKGFTSLYNGNRVPKSDSRIMALGYLDQLSVKVAECYCASLGVYIPECTDIFDNIVEHLFDLCSCVATPPDSSETKLKRTSFNPEFISYLETQIDALDATLPKITNFVKPYGTHLTLCIHNARVVCRMAETHLAAIADMDADVKKYVNRLSDLLFVCARKSNKGRFEEEIYKKK